MKLFCPIRTYSILFSFYVALLFLNLSNTTFAQGTIIVVGDIVGKMIRKTSDHE